MNRTLPIILADQRLADRIGIVELALGDIDHRGLANAADFERAEIGPVDGGGRIHPRRFLQTLRLQGRPDGRGLCQQPCPLAGPC